MPQYNKTEMERTARKYGFTRDTFEKVFRLKKILLYFNSSDLLKNHFLLKGGTAINLMIFDMPRLSVDIDLDFVPDPGTEKTAELREKIKKALLKYMDSEGYTYSSSSYSRYSLDSFQFGYINSGGGSDIIKIELNYSLRTHLFEAEERTFTPFFFSDHTLISCVSAIEIFAAKTIALLTRAAARDLYDFVNMINHNLFEDKRDLFRKSIIFYASVSSDEINDQFDTAAIDSINQQMIRSDLMPVLKKPERVIQYDLSSKISIVKEYLSDLMILTENERNYLQFFRTGEYRPELLFSDDEIIERVKNHPMALWKCRIDKGQMPG